MGRDVQFFTPKLYAGNSLATQEQDPGTLRCSPGAAVTCGTSRAFRALRRRRGGLRRRRRGRGRDRRRGDRGRGGGRRRRRASYRFRNVHLAECGTRFLQAAPAVWSVLVKSFGVKIRAQSFPSRLRPVSKENSAEASQNRHVQIAETHQSR